MNNQLLGHERVFIPHEIEATRRVAARRSIIERRHRRQIFGASAEDVPWDILLLLYYNHNTIDFKITGIHAEIGASATTALRWLNHLEKEGFTLRHSHPTDGRIFYVTLSPAGKSTLDLYFDKINALVVSS